MPQRRGNHYLALMVAILVGVACLSAVVAPVASGTSGASSNIAPVPVPEPTTSRVASNCNADALAPVRAGRSQIDLEQKVSRFYQPLLGLDDIRPIYEPTITAPEQAGLDSDELVIGLSTGGEARAYPVRTLRFRKIVNDELAGTPILVTG